MADNPHDNLRPNLIRAFEVGVRLTERDLRLLTFLGRYRYATVEQIARYLGTSQAALRRRLPRLERSGLLSSHWTAVTRPKLWLATSAGLRTAGTDLPAAQVSWATMRHTLALVDLGITCEAAGESVVTEREIRAALSGPRMATSDPRLEMYGNWMPSLVVPVPGRTIGHIPDMVLLRPPYPNGTPGAVALEVELNRKTQAEWTRIVNSYASSPYDKVVYYAGNAEITRALKRLIREAGPMAERKIQVTDFRAPRITDKR